MSSKTCHTHCCCWSCLCLGLSGSLLNFGEGWWASGEESIWTNQSCSAKKDVVFMATQHGRAYVQSAGERKINETNKSRSKKTGHLLRGKCVLLYLMYSWKVCAGCFVPMPAHFVGLCLSNLASAGYPAVISFPFQTAERGRGSVCKQTPEGPVTVKHHPLQQVWGKKK